jgi:hypothetical protein
MKLGNESTRPRLKVRRGQSNFGGYGMHSETLYTLVYIHIDDGRSCNYMTGRVLTMRSTSAGAIAVSSGGQMMRLRGLRIAAMRSAASKSGLNTDFPLAANASQSEAAHWIAFLLTLALLSSSLQAQETIMKHGHTTS